MVLDAQRRQEVIERVARRAVRMHLTAPAILFLEMNKPLAYLGAQVVWASQPFLNMWLDRDETRDLALLLEDRAGVEALIHHLESLRTDEAHSSW